MNKINTIIPLTLLIMFVCSCNSKKKEALSNLKKMENEINASMSTKFDEKKADDYIEACKKFAENYPEDTSCSNVLFKAGRLAMNLQQSDKADESVVLFDKVITNYPKSKDAPLALFMKGFYLENNMKNLSKAAEAYKEFLSKYPNNQLAKDAQNSLDNLGKPLDQVIKEFQAKQKDTSSVKSKTGMKM